MCEGLDWGWIKGRGGGKRGGWEGDVGKGGGLKIGRGRSRR